MQRVNHQKLAEELALFAKNNCVPCRNGGVEEECQKDRQTKMCLYMPHIGQKDLYKDKYLFIHGKYSRQEPRHYVFYPERKTRLILDYLLAQKRRVKKHLFIASLFVFAYIVYELLSRAGF